MSHAILYDATLCVGCKECERACAQENHLPYDDAIAKEEKTSDHKFTSLVVRADDKFMRRICMHCEDPSCASVCPVGALHKTKNGPVLYDEDKCMGCRYCMVGCPFGVPKYEWNALLPRVRKCIMCPQRTENGKPTACAEICPTGATMYGDRDTLIAEARRRLAAKEQPYINHIFGLEEVGGTSVLMLSANPFEMFGMKASYPKEPLPRLTYNVLEKIPDITSVGFLVLGGVWWITNRRNEVAAAEHAERLTKSSTNEHK